MKVHLLILSLCLSLSSIICLNNSNLKQINSSLTLPQGNNIIPQANPTSGISIKNTAVSVTANPLIQVSQVKTVITEEEKYQFNDLNTFRQKALDEHNRLRQIHNAPKVKMSKSLNTSAQLWANYLANADMYANLTQNKDFTKSNKENSEIYQNVLEKSQFPFSGKEMTDYWYKQGETYNFATFTPLNESENTEAFIQIIWKGTSEVGIGRAFGKNGYYGVTYYRSSAKESNQYPINISPPIQTQLKIIVSTFTGRLFNNSVERSVSVDSSTLSTPILGNGNMESSDNINQQYVNPNKKLKSTAIIIKNKRVNKPLNVLQNVTGSSNNQAITNIQLNQNNQTNLPDQYSNQQNQNSQLNQINQTHSSTPAGVLSTSTLTPNTQQQYYNENKIQNNQMYPQQPEIAKKLRKKKLS